MQSSSACTQQSALFPDMLQTHIPSLQANCELPVASQVSSDNCVTPTTTATDTIVRPNVVDQQTMARNASPRTEFSTDIVDCAADSVGPREVTLDQGVAATDLNECGSELPYDVEDNGSQLEQPSGLRFLLEYRLYFNRYLVA
ncbi:hypothetical protein V6N12_076474 [Hibiscus sabdariffa]|uniref:Uncharacterized protein n=1 Tax=Hibiscus sabdariffa TaxID=183260 RepID=A0ABR2D9W7_9ROSI